MTARVEAAGVRPLIRSAFLFGVIGVINNATTYALFAVMTLLGVGAIAAATVSYVVGMSISFIGNRRVTFRHGGSRRSALIRFVIANAVGYGINISILWILISRAQFSQLLAQLTAICFVAVFTFFTMRLWVFRDTHEVPIGAEPTPKTAIDRNEKFPLSVAVLAVSSAAAVVDRLRRKTRLPFPLGVVTVIVSVIALWVVANLTINPFNVTVDYEQGQLIACVVLALLAAPLFYIAAKAAATVLLQLPLVAVVAVFSTLIGAGFAIQLVIGHATLAFPGFDAAVILTSALELVHDSGPTAYDYYQTYPNNVFLLVVLWKFLLFVSGKDAPIEEYLWDEVILNAVMLSLGLLLMTLVAKRIGGMTVAVIAFVLGSIFIVISPWIGTTYTDSLTLAFPIGMVYIFLRAAEATSPLLRWPLWIILAVVAAVGYSLKPTVIFTGMALVIVSLLWRPVGGARMLARRATVVVALSVVFGLSVTIITNVANSVGAVAFDLKANEKAFPPTHFLKMGAQGNGAYSAEDIAASAAIPTYRERSQEGLDIYFQRVSDLGPIGYAQFLGTKLQWTMGDGTFFQWKEGGTENPAFIYDGKVSSAVQDIYGPRGAHHGSLVLLWQSIWVLLLILIAAPLFFRGRPKLFGFELTVLRVSVLALIVFLLLFETRSRYLYLYLPFFVILAAASLDSIAWKYRGWLRNKRRSANGATVEA